MRLDELFRNLGYLAGTIGAQMRDGAFDGVPLAELDLTGPAPRKGFAVRPGASRAERGRGVPRRCRAGPSGEEVLFARHEHRLGVSGGDARHRRAHHVARAAQAGGGRSGRMTAAKLARDGKVSIAGSGRLEVAAVEGGRLKVSIAGSGRARHRRPGRRTRAVDRRQRELRRRGTGGRERGRPHRRIGRRDLRLQRRGRRAPDGLGQRDRARLGALQRAFGGLGHASLASASGSPPISAGSKAFAGPAPPPGSGRGGLDRRVRLWQAGRMRPRSPDARD